MQPDAFAFLNYIYARECARNTDFGSYVGDYDSCIPNRRMSKVQWTNDAGRAYGTLADYGGRKIAYIEADVEGFNVLVEPHG